VEAWNDSEDIRREDGPHLLDRRVRGVLPPEPLVASGDKCRRHWSSATDPATRGSSRETDRVDEILHGVADGVLEQIGPRLWLLRQFRFVTLSALAEATGISTGTLSRLETGPLCPPAAR